MSLFVLDTSAVLVYLWQEPGWERVAEILAADGHVISAVNVAELVGKAAEHAMPADQVAAMLAALKIDIRPFDASQALAAGLLRPVTCHLGFSLGDRACLALAQQVQGVAVTADRLWMRFEGGIAVECVRGGATP